MKSLEKNIKELKKKVPRWAEGAPGGVPERKRPRKEPERAKKDAACVLEPYGRLARGWPWTP